jgi:hypothetical protein
MPRQQGQRMGPAEKIVAAGRGNNRNPVQISEKR